MFEANNPLTTPEELSKHLEHLTAQLDAQAAEITRLQSELVQREAGQFQASSTAATIVSQASQNGNGRRALLKLLMLAPLGAAAALLTDKPETASANVNGTISRELDDEVKPHLGLISMPDSAAYNPSHDFRGYIGVWGISDSNAPAPFNGTCDNCSPSLPGTIAGVFGASSDGAGVDGISRNGVGVHGQGSVGVSGIGGTGVFGNGTSQDGVQGLRQGARSGAGVFGILLTYIGFDTPTPLPPSMPAPGAGVYGFHSGTNTQSPNDPNNTGFGVFGRCDAPSGAGVSGFSQNGNAVSGHSPGNYGGYFSGGRAPLRLEPSNNSGKPSHGLHQRGEFYVDSEGTLFYCTADGTPGTWASLFSGGSAQFRLEPAESQGHPISGLHRKGEFYVDSEGVLFYCTADGTPGTWINLLSRGGPPLP